MVKGTGAFQCYKNNRKLVIAVCAIFFGSLINMTNSWSDSSYFDIQLMEAINMQTLFKIQLSECEHKDLSHTDTVSLHQRKK